MRPRVTVITPVHDAEATLPAAIASLHDQHEQRFEHLLVDDGSRDDGPRQLAAG